MHKRQEIFLMKILLFLFLTFGLSLGFSFQAKAAVSINNIQTSTGGTFKKAGKNWVYRDVNNKLAKDCLLKIDGKIYYFSPRGYRFYGWKTIQGKDYYFGTISQGYMYRNKSLIENGKRYYLKNNGQKAVGFLTFKKNGKTYYFDKNGVRQSGWKTINQKKYYFGTASQGWMYKSTFVTSNEKLFYLSEDGSMATGWTTVANNKYYFTASGAYTGRHTIAGTIYHFGTDGKLLYTGPNLSISSPSAILIDASTGKVIYAKNEETRRATASTSQIMTCILALENCELDDVVTVSSNATGTEGSKLSMKEGEKFLLIDLLYSLMLSSHNDTAVAVAEHVSGSTGAFSQLMNKKAKAIGCTKTHFVTPSGLDTGVSHYSTALDMAKIAKYAYANSTFRSIVRHSSYSINSLSNTAYRIYSTNELLGKITGVNGMNSGYTKKAGYCSVSTIKSKSGKSYISVVLGASSSDDRWNDSKTLLQYAYSL